MAQALRQSTAYTFQFGPFLNSIDGNTPENSLTIGAEDVFLSKNGAAYAVKSDTTDLTGTSDTRGYYDCVLDTTDTGTLGKLDVFCHFSGALYVEKHFMVIPANVYDSLIAGSDYLEVDTVVMAGSAPATEDEVAAAVAEYEDFAVFFKWLKNKMVRTDNLDGTITYVYYDDDGTTPLLTYVYTTATETRAKAT